MNFDINSAVFIGFLLINLAVGLWSSRGVTTIRGYALGERNFSTGTLVAAIVALWVSGEFFATIVTESYNEGLIFMSILTGNVLSFLIIGMFFAPRLSEFLGKISIAEAMGELYGSHVRVITAIAGFIGVSGIIAIQLQIAGLLFQYSLGVPLFYGIIISGVIVTLYSSLGGIKAVTFTDVIQFITFGIVIPSIAAIFYSDLNSDTIIMDTLNNNSKFNYKEVFTLDHPELYYYISLFFWILIPSFNPGVFQRISMARDIKQVKNAFIVSAVAVLFFTAILCWISILLISEYPNLAGNDILKFIILDYQWVAGFKGLIIAGIMAMIMSTVDSYINSNSILMIHDLKDALRLKFIKNELFSTRICASLIGTLAILVALRGGNFFELMIWTSVGYMPIVTVPFIMTLLGFRSSSKSVLAGMAAGLVTVIIWELFIKGNISNIATIIPAMLANLTFLLGYHYLFKQKGGWVGIKDPNVLVELRAQKKADRAKLLESIKNFSFTKLLRKNTPTDEGMVALLGVAIIILAFITAVNVPRELQVEYKSLIIGAYISTLFFTASLISYPVWDPRWKYSTFIAICWNATVLYVLAGFGFFMLLFTGFGEVQIIIYMTNILIIVSLINWRWALVLIATGMIIVVSIYKLYLPDLLLVRGLSVESKIIYMIFLVGSVVIAFLKPKQKYIEDLETENIHLDHELEDLDSKVTSLNDQVSNLNEKIVHYDEKIAEKEQEITRLGHTAQKILNNVNHELRLPVGNVMNFSEMLHEGLGKFNDTQLKTLSDEVFKNSTRLSSMLLNMLDLATLDVKQVGLNKKTINFSELVENRVRECRKIYLDNKPIKISLAIDPEILLSVDPNYMRQVVDNLVINAIKFSEEGTINVRVQRQKHSIIFTIQDEGIGIPSKDIHDIFTPFKMGSNTESKAEGRGVGLALCKSVIEAHSGSIKAESKAVGALFRFALPV